MRWGQGEEEGCWNERVIQGSKNEWMHNSLVARPRHHITSGGSIHWDNNTPCPGPRTCHMPLHNKNCYITSPCTCLQWDTTDIHKNPGEKDIKFLFAWQIISLCLSPLPRLGAYKLISGLHTQARLLGIRTKTDNQGWSKMAKGKGPKPI